jgi:glucokinase
LVVVGGGVSGLGEWWWNALQVGVRREALSSLLDTPVVPAALGTDAALIGAAELAWEIA